jgi:hypothetical protein
MKSHEQRMREIRESIESYNEKASERLAVDAIIDWLRGEHSTEEALDLLGYKDLLGYRDSEGKRIPEPLAKELLRLCRGADRDEREKIKIIVDATPEAEAARLSHRELIERYDPDDSSNAFGTRLATIAGKDNKQNPNTFLIFDGDELNRGATLKELERLRAVLSSRSIATYDGTPHETFAVGDRPARYKEQSPWNPQEALYDGKSNAGVPWGGLPKDTKQLVLIASTSNQSDFQKYTEIELFELLERAHNEKPPFSFKLAARLFPEAFIKWRNLERQGNLPSLKIPAGGDSATAASATPSSATTAGITPAPAGS